MKRISLLLILGLTLAGFKSHEKNDLQHDPDADRKAIEQIIGDYKKSINQFDTTLAKTFWLTTEEVSFIHPKGHEKGWEGVKKGIYEMFGSRFSQRDLKSYNEQITLYGDMAVVEFYWIFDAVFSGEDPAVLQTKGRETQVLKKFGGEWKLVHVHYSGMPKTGEREGF